MNEWSSLQFEKKHRNLNLKCALKLFLTVYVHVILYAMRMKNDKNINMRAFFLFIHFFFSFLNFNVWIFIVNLLLCKFCTCIFKFECEYRRFERVLLFTTCPIEYMFCNCELNKVRSKNMYFYVKYCEKIYNSKN